VKTGVIPFLADSCTYSVGKLAFAFHVALPLPVFTPPARY